MINVTKRIILIRVNAERFYAVQTITNMSFKSLRIFIELSKCKKLGQ